jgi:VWFA-related protein
MQQRTRIIRSVVSLACIAALCATSIGTGRLRAQDVTFVIDSKLVVINVSVKDKSGNPVTNLKREDFLLTEDNVPQKISQFDVQEITGDPLAPMSFATRPETLETRVTPSPANAAVVAPNQRDPKKYEDKRLIALFFDMSSMEAPDQARAQESAIKFVQSQMTAADLVSIMTFSNKFRVVEEFTQDRDLLIAALRKLTLGEGSDLAATGATSADEGDDSGSFTADQTEFNIFNTDRKLTALGDAARKLSVYPEKKALIYFSGGVQSTGVENVSQLKATVNTAIRSNVSFYTVDARGLTASAPGGDASTASPRGTGILTGSRQQGLRDSQNNSQETLYTLAADTGGKAFQDSNDLSLGIRAAQEDIRTYYTLAYYSTNTADDGRYRRVRIQLNGTLKNAGYKLDYRQGYYASKSWKQFTSADRERQLEEALTMGDPVSELPLAVEVDYFRVAKDRYFVPISVKIPGSAIGLTKKGANQTTSLDFIGQVRDGNGRLAGGVRDEITVKLTEQNAAQFDRRHLQYDSGLTLGPGNYDLVFLAREAQTGKMGTFETKFTIPDLNATKTMKLSSMILSSQIEPVAAAVGAADNNKKLLANHPLVQEGQKLVPSITRVFRKDQSLTVYVEAYDPSTDPDTRMPQMMGTLELLQGARKVFVSRPLRLTQLSSTRPGVAILSFVVPLARIDAGEYVAQVDVFDMLQKKFSFPRSTLVVVP